MSFAHPGHTPSTADEAALLVRNDHEPHVAMAATEKIKFAWDAVKATDNLHGDIVEVVCAKEEYFDGDGIFSTPRST